LDHRQTSATTIKPPNLLTIRQDLILSPLQAHSHSKASITWAITHQATRSRSKQVTRLPHFGSNRSTRLHSPFQLGAKCRILTPTRLTSQTNFKLCRCRSGCAFILSSSSSSSANRSNLQTNSLLLVLLLLVRLIATQVSNRILLLLAQRIPLLVAVRASRNINIGVVSVCVFLAPGACQSC